MSPSTLLCLLALTGAPVGPDWWTLAFEEERWEEAVPLALEAPAARKLAYVLMLEADAARLEGGEGGIPPEPRIRSCVIAGHWEAWALRAAFAGAEAEPLGRALERALELSRAGYPDRQLKRIEAVKRLLLEDLEPGDPRAALVAPAEDAGWTTMDGGSLPGTVSGRLVLLAGDYRFKGTIKVAPDAELWIERGAALLPAADAKLLVNGALHVFGASDQPVRFGAGREWVGIEYQTDVQHLLADVVIRSARTGIDLAGSRLHLIDSTIDGCATGIDANTYNLWCERVLFTDCSEVGLVHHKGEGDSFLRHCSFVKNEVGLQLRDAGVVRVWNSELSRNQVPLRALSGRAKLLVRNTNFLGRNPVELHGGTPFDLRQNYWGTRSPNFAREVVFHDEREQGDAFLDPPLAAKVAAAGAPQAD